MPLQKFLFKPGINKEGTAYSNEGGWFDSNLVRFRKGLPEKIGGWAKASGNSFKATGRGLHPWVALNGTRPGVPGLRSCPRGLPTLFSGCHHKSC